MQTAIDRLTEAVGEIERMARTDPAIAGEGVVLLLDKLTPAEIDIDSSSGALGNATAGIVEKLVSIRGGRGCSDSFPGLLSGTLRGLMSK